MADRISSRLDRELQQANERLRRELQDKEAAMQHMTKTIAALVEQLEACERRHRADRALVRHMRGVIQDLSGELGASNLELNRREQEEEDEDEDGEEEEEQKQKH